MERKGKLIEKTNKNSNFNLRPSEDISITDEDFLEDIDDLEEIIGDDVFASFLNSDAEIQIGPDIYKYTDVGLFITKDYSKLNTFLEVRNISKDLLIRTDVQSVLQVKNEFEGGLTVIDEDMSYFRVPLDNDNPCPYLSADDLNNPCEEYSGGGGYSGGSSSTTGGTSNTNNTYESYINTLTPCNPSSGFFGSLFGTNKVCKDKYESKRRVKTKAFNYNYFIAYHIGVKVKHQYKGWTGIWRKENTEEIGLLVESAMFKYDISPIIGSALSNLNQNQAFVSPNLIIPTSNRGYYNLNIDWSNNFTPLSFVYTSTYPYPFEIFRDDLVIELWGNNNFVDWAVDQGNDQVTREKLNEYAWNILYDKTKSYLRSHTSSGNYNIPDNATIISKHDIGQIWVHKSNKKFKTNNDKVEKTYDWGVGIGFTLKESNGFSILKAQPEPSNIIRPKAFGAKLYGLVKNNGLWHGSLIEF